MKFLAAFILGASVAYAAQPECTYGSRGCRKDGASFQMMDEVTKSICNKIRESDCLCSQTDAIFCGVQDHNIESFEQQCVEYGEGWYPLDC